jgi:uncharacterized tellurite resistance protein B-like protein
MVYTMKTPSRAPLLQIEPLTDTLMRLLTQIILADGHIHATEVDALVRGVQRLGLTDKFARDLTEANIRDWFDDYKHSLNADTSPLPQDVALTYMILKLADWPNKQAVIDVLTEISLSDADFHIKEKSLISIVRAYWQFEGLDAPNAKIRT